MRAAARMDTASRAQKASTARERRSGRRSTARATGRGSTRRLRWRDVAMAASGKPARRAWMAAVMPACPPAPAARTAASPLATVQGSKPSAPAAPRPSATRCTAPARRNTRPAVASGVAHSGSASAASMRSGSPSASSTVATRPRKRRVSSSRRCTTSHSSSMLSPKRSSPQRWGSGAAASVAAMADTTEDTRVPVTVLTGFLGSGKTTLLNRILSENHGKKLAVIENEFGEVGVDDALVKRRFDTQEEIFEMNNGCICCTVRGDLIRILSKLLKRKERLDGIVIETTGMADPAPVAQTFFMDESMKEFARLDAVVTLVDAKHLIQHLDEEKPEGAENEAVEQVVFADRVLLNKTDLVSEEELLAVEARIRALNKYAPIVRCVRAEVPMEVVLGVRAFDLERILEIDPEFLEDGDHEHDARITSIGFVKEGTLDMGRLNAWVSKLLQEKGVDIFRMKGVLAIEGAADKYVFQAVHMLFTGETLEPWAEGEARVNKLIVIGRDLPREEITGGFEACFVKASEGGAQLPGWVESAVAGAQGGGGQPAA
mmetsp:Transcript_10533/g.35742  ORF Transcript_10533/g.35742 Transcript_10533/m.35742 type:complete len:546 (+) Transcript_10533:433-2070(+)